MVKVYYTSRLVCDKHFLDWVLKQEPSVRRQILRKLMFIKSSSISYPREHNVILEEEFYDVELQKLAKDKLKKDAEANLRGAVKPRETPQFLKYENDDLSRCIRYAVYLTNEKPYNSCILTSPEKEAEYKSNKHFTRITSTVFVKSEDGAISIIEKFFKKFEITRENSC